MSIQSSGEYEDKGLRLLNEHKPEEALRVFEEGARRFPGDSELVMGTAMARLRMGDFVGACSILEGLRDSRPNAETHQALVEGYLARGMVREAMLTAEQAVKLGGPDEKLAYRLARSFYNRKRFREALPIYERAAEIKPDWSEAWFGLGACYWALKQTASAEAALRRAVSLDAEDWQARQFLGCVLHDLGRKDEARATLQTVPLEAEWQRPALERLVALSWWPSEPEKRQKMETLWRRVTGAAPPTGVMGMLEEVSRKLDP